VWNEKMRRLTFVFRSRNALRLHDSLIQSYDKLSFAVRDSRGIRQNMKDELSPCAIDSAFYKTMLHKGTNCQTETPDMFDLAKDVYSIHKNRINFFVLALLLIHLTIYSILIS
jgi:hypothetical protein